MPLDIIIRTKYMGSKLIEGVVLPESDLKHFPSSLHFNRRLSAQISNSNGIAPFRGCCMANLTKYVRLDESHFGAHSSWDLFAICETSYKVFRNVENETSHTTVVRFALTPHYKNDDHIRQWPKWKYLGECMSCMVRLVMEDKIRSFLDNQKSSNLCHFHMDIFADGVVGERSGQTTYGSRVPHLMKKIYPGTPDQKETARIHTTKIDKQQNVFKDVSNQKIAFSKKG